MLSYSIFDIASNAFILHLWHGIQCFHTPFSWSCRILVQEDHARNSIWITETFVRLYNQRELPDNQCVNITGWKKIWHFIHVQKYENSWREMYYGIRKQFSDQCWHLGFCRSKHAHPKCTMDFSVSSHQTAWPKHLIYFVYEPIVIPNDWSRYEHKSFLNVDYSSKRLLPFTYTKIQIIFACFIYVCMYW